MIFTNILINNALQRVGIIGDGETAPATQAMTALSDLQSVIVELNTEDYLLENYVTYDANVSNKIRFAVRPKEWKEVDSVAVVDLLLSENKTTVGEVYKIKNTSEFYTIRWDSVDQKNKKDSNPNFNKYMSEYWPTFNVDAIPDRCIGVARKVGNRFQQLIPADKMMIDAQSKGHMANIFAIDTEYVDVDVLHDPDDPNYRPYSIEYFNIEFDSSISNNYRITILKGIKLFNIDEPLKLSNKYASMIEDGLCVKLCQRYKYLELKGDFEKDFESAKTMIRRINATNRPMLYDRFADGSNSYYNLLNGCGWG